MALRSEVWPDRERSAVLRHSAQAGWDAPVVLLAEHDCSFGNGELQPAYVAVATKCVAMSMSSFAGLRPNLSPAWRNLVGSICGQRASTSDSRLHPCTLLGLWLRPALFLGHGCGSDAQQVRRAKMDEKKFQRLMASLDELSREQARIANETLEALWLERNGNHESSMDDVDVSNDGEGKFQECLKMLSMLPSDQRGRVSDALQKLNSGEKHFEFEDLLEIDDRSIQLVLRETEPDCLLMALKGASKYLLSKIFANMSKRAAQQLKDALLNRGPVRFNEAQAAQQKIREIVARLATDGLIVLSYPDSSTFSRTCVLLDGLTPNQRDFIRGELDRLEYKNGQEEGFRFWQIENLDDASLRRLLEETPIPWLVDALTQSTESMRQKICNNLAHKEMAALLDGLEERGPIRLYECMEAQEKVLVTVSRLLASGRISLPSRRDCQR